jgi:hypothetical protein
MSAKHGLLGSSPSSGGAETAQGTPETRLTPFSSVKSIKPSVSLGSHGEGLRLSADHVSTHRLGFDSLDKDPFISNSSHMKGEQSILSPTASAFQPYALRISQEMSHASGIALSPTFSGELYPQQSRQHSSTSPSSISGVADISTQWCTFSTDSRSVSRALKISGIVETVQVEAVQACIQVNYRFFCMGLSSTPFLSLQPVYFTLGDLPVPPINGGFCSTTVMPEPNFSIELLSTYPIIQQSYHLCSTTVAGVGVE